MHTVIGPTPPGTGVITEAICFTTSKSTSPTILPGLSPYEIPTSITTAPSLTFRIRRGCPAALITTSAFITHSSKLVVSL